MKIQVNRCVLLDRIKANLEEHKEIYAEALQNYTNECTAALEDRMVAIRAKSITNPHTFLDFRLVCPTEHIADYTRAIGMLELHTEPTILLDEEQYANYVEDEWHWKRLWNQNTLPYSSKG